MPVPVKSLLLGRKPPVTVTPADPLPNVLSAVTEYDYVAVVDDEQRPIGVVSSQSILKAMRNFRVAFEKLRVSDAFEKQPPQREDLEIFDLLDLLNNQSAVLVMDDRGALTGLITPLDMAHYFRERAEAMMLIEDIEENIREHIRACYNDDGPVMNALLVRDMNEVASAPVSSLMKETVARYAGARSEKIDQDVLEQVVTKLSQEEKPDLDRLTLHQYVDLLTRRWNGYDGYYSIDSDALRNMLEPVRQLRNKVAHFRDDLSSEDLQQLLFCAEWFENNKPVRGVAETFQRVMVSRPTDEVDTLVPLDEEVLLADNRYVNLSNHLEKFPEERRRLALAFTQIEQLIGAELPPSARKHRAWWANDSHSHTQSKLWLAAGWRVDSVNMSEGVATFIRYNDQPQKYKSFYKGLLTELRKSASFPINAAPPNGANWYTVGYYRDHDSIDATMGFSFVRGTRFRVELYIDAGVANFNKNLLSRLSDDAGMLEAQVENPNQNNLTDLDVEVRWETLDNRRAARLGIYHPSHEISIENKGDWDELQAWAVLAMKNFEKVVTPLMGRLGLRYSPESVI